MRGSGDQSRWFLITASAVHCMHENVCWKMSPSSMRQHERLLSSTQLASKCTLQVIINLKSNRSVLFLRNAINHYAKMYHIFYKSIHLIQFFQKNVLLLVFTNLIEKLAVGLTSAQPGFVHSHTVKTHLSADPSDTNTFIYPIEVKDSRKSGLLNVQP